MGTRKPATPPTRGQPGATAAQRRLAAQRAEAAGRRIAGAQRRRQRWVVGGSLAALAAVVLALVIVKVATGSGGPVSGQRATAASAAVLAKVSGVPAATLDTVGAGTSQTAPSAVSAPALTSAGKPEVLYIGAEYCPFCAAERWAVAVALSRFGTLHGVGETKSSATDVFPNTATLSFHDATYTGDTVAFTAKEIQSNQVVNGQYAALDKLTPQQQAIFDKYNAPPYVSSRGSIPFIDIGGKYLVSGAGYDPAVLSGKSHQQIADALADPASPVAKAVDGTANLITAAICASTADKPTAVCSSRGVTSAAAKLAPAQ